MVANQNNISIPTQIKYYTCAGSKETIEFEHFADIISSRSSLTQGDSFSVLVSMIAFISKAFAEGKIVKIDILVTFALTLTDKGTVSPEP
ncbi:MAG: hypothetical protein NWQ14_05720 [Flavobacterium sp.]|nr:hypothetical protein [Flavobacterium sp.]